MRQQLRIIAGLGNPGKKHARTLHNVGFWFVDALGRKLGGDFRFEKKFDAELCRVALRATDIWLVKPQSYMNLSGGPIRGVLDYYRLRPEQLLVAHDEIDLSLGTVRLKKGGGHGGHNGIRDVVNHCGADFMRLRFGVGHPGDKSQVTNYVLQRGSGEAETAIQNNIDEAIDVLDVLLDDGLDAAMKILHTRIDP